MCGFAKAEFHMLLGQQTDEHQEIGCVYIGCEGKLTI